MVRIFGEGGGNIEEEKAPSTNDFAKLYSINPATAAKGINILVDSGVLYKKRGIGMFVAKGAKAMIKDKRKSEFMDNYVTKLVDEAKNLGKKSFDEITHKLEELGLGFRPSDD